MSDDNAAKNLQYMEVSDQRGLGSLADSSPSENSDLYGGYLSKNISLFGKCVIGFMLLSFVVSFLFLIFSYTPYGTEFLREFKFQII